MLKSSRSLKLIQYFLYFLSILFLIFSIICTKFDFLNSTPIQSKKEFEIIFPNISHLLWGIKGVSIFICLQAISLFAFFGIALFLGLKILSSPLSESQKNQIIISPCYYFNKIIFSKILFGNTIPTSTQVFDLKNKTLISAADLYLLHFKTTNKAYGLTLMAFVVFAIPHLLNINNRPIYLQLLTNFIYLNLLLFLFLEIVLFIFSKIRIRIEKNV